MSLFLDSHSITVIAPPNTFAPRIGAANLLRDSAADVSASADTVGGEKENAYKEGLTYDFWRPGTGGAHWLRAHLADGARRSNYVAIAAHDLHQHGASIKMQHSTDGGATWSDSSDDHAPGSSSPIMLLYDDTFAADHRLLVTSVSAVQIGVVHFGEVLELNAPLAGPWAPPYLSRANRYINEIAEGGAFLGKSIIAEGARLALNIKGVDLDWIRDKWEATVRLIETRGFFFAARDVAAAGGVSEIEVFYGWAEVQPAARYENNVYGAIALSARGIVT